MKKSLTILFTIFLTTWVVKAWDNLNNYYNEMYQNSVIKSIEVVQEKLSWLKTNQVVFWNQSKRNKNKIKEKKVGWSEKISFFYDRYYEKQLLEEAQNRKDIQVLLDKISEDEPVMDHKINTLSRYIQKTYAKKWNFYYIIWIKLNKTSYFKIWDKYILFEPYTISWNKNNFEVNVKKMLNSILINQEAEDEDKLKWIKSILNKYKIKFQVLSWLSDKVKIYIWENNNSKIQLENQYFLIDKYYKADKIPNIDKDDVFIYTIVDKLDLEKNNLIWESSSNVSMKLQSFIEFWWITYSNWFLWWNWFIKIDKNGWIKAEQINTIFNYKINKDNSKYFLWVVFLALSFCWWIIFTYLYYQRKYKVLIKQTTEWI